MNLFLFQLRGELRKMFARKRTWIGFGAFLVLEIVLLIVLHLDGPMSFWKRIIERQGQMFEFYFSAPTIGYIILGLSTMLLGGIYISLVAGDIVAKEAEDGTLRMVLGRPISRLRLLLLKYASCLIYNVLFVLFMGTTCYLLGACLRGFSGGFFAFAPEQGVVSFFPAAQGLGRYALAVVFLSLTLCTVSSIGFFFSCLPIKPAAATILTLSYLFIDMVLVKGQFMEDYEHLLVTSYIDTWLRTCLTPIPWMRIVRDLVVLAGVNSTFFILGWAVFQSRDFKT